MEALTENPTWGWFGLVYYVPDPLRSAVQTIREMLPGDKLPPAHITVLPPRLSSLPPGPLCHRIGVRLAQLAAFEITLSGISSFAETDYVYIDVAEGGAQLRQLHEMLNEGELLDKEIFNFHPHLTLAGPVPRELLVQTREAASRAWQLMPPTPRLVINEVVCLWRPRDNHQAHWHKVGSCPLDIRHDSATIQAMGRT